MVNWKTDLKKFQRERGLKADGIIGPRTWAVISGAVYFPTKPTNLKSFTTAQALKFYGDPLAGKKPSLALGRGTFTPDSTWRGENIIYVRRDNKGRVAVPKRLLLPAAAADISNLHARLPFHKKVAERFVCLMHAWDKAGLLPLIKSWNGSTVFRAIRRPGSVKLSRHAFGGAFDINAKWNGMGKHPADVNIEGSVMRLVDIAAQHRFYWGGWFRDAMHFEYARRV